MMYIHFCMFIKLYHKYSGLELLVSMTRCYIMEKKRLVTLMLGLQQHQLTDGSVPMMCF